MRFTQYYLDCLSQASYLIADETTGRAVLVDPRRDIGEYLVDARTHGLTIEGVINTHFHADFLAGHLEVAAATGAWIGYGQRADTEYEIRKLTDGERVSLGDVTLQVMETPGHTPESISVLVYEHATDSTPYGVLTGDALFIGDVGRPDLLASAGVTADELGRMLHDSVQHKLMALPDEVRVFPAHGAGSACGKNLSTERQSTIGEQRRTNYACAPMNVDQFLTLVTAGQPTAPGYFAFDAALNRQARDLFDHDVAPRALTTKEFAEARTAGAIVIDARDPHEFAAGHLRGALNIPADGRFAETAGTVAQPGDTLLVVADPDRAEEIVIRLARIGFDRVLGYLYEPETTLPQMEADLTRASRVTAADLRTALDSPQPPVVLDVRGAGEREQGAIDGSAHIPLPELRCRITEIPTDRPVVVHCAGGYRSSVAASLLRATGHPDASDLLGGYAAWQLTVAPSAV
ncbi:glyoxylase-like metal-dependent hydrolase (beta-lactamase superfamily II)/rhodanese-related sulfurtransferase [Actinoplanes campanulatus]|uniref:Glyoxylase-like metal-dependent hydrolase (Beta-lactamase superfamily II)/rhodanese-related sulfurtransferase n=1 Tax=Actinoplanes campanulatus TaxID=113559 RepID=A0A7W5AFV0_9ACTN|nr:MBL fold metallo-hydrolase [Actinoplanes campanulatus]MBB3095448.1 glyoxylase-like metal-dependent hydrolase (beta-lactamase superfamily II)/rhodanese-related sulfurtransferase [Actinoplanes campanulatus]GGN09047.1 MBL fold hydrolase [Actinoplanes campanulatus]GID36331.1 MBL fold hydrolase [Actinoplanes campanulatus]